MKPYRRSSAEPGEESTEGATQNALEFLKGESVQPSDDMSNDTDEIQPQGTLTIQDLLNAQGVGDTTGTAPVDPNDKPLPDGDTPDKDRSGSYNHAR